ncbi:histone H3.v1, partial [Ophiophagus hannah]
EEKEKEEEEKEEEEEEKEEEEKDKETSLTVQIPARLQALNKIEKRKERKEQEKVEGPGCAACKFYADILSPALTFYLTNHANQIYIAGACRSQVLRHSLSSGAVSTLTRVPTKDSCIFDVARCYRLEKEGGTRVVWGRWGVEREAGESLICAGSSSPAPCSSRTPYTTPDKWLSNLLFKTSRDGAPTTSGGKTNASHCQEISP